MKYSECNTTVTPKITFGIIVLNGEPFTKFCLRSLYPFAHQIIVVEGACSGAESIATSDGHSLDGTIESLQEFKENEDEKDILTIVSKTGFWSEKDEQSRAYAERATGDYLWQVDIDEFYRATDMQCILDYLSSYSDIDAISFRLLTFWGSPKYICDSWRLRQVAFDCHRLFKWKKDYKYSSHRPPTIINENGSDLRALNWVNANRTKSMGIYLFHYSLLLPSQVRMKGKYYSNSPLLQRTGWADWMKNSYFTLNKPYHVYNMYEYPSWLERYSGEHPIQILKMWTCISNGVIPFKIRNNDDVEKLLASPIYRLGRAFLKFYSPIDSFIRRQVTNRVRWHINNLRSRR